MANIDEAILRRNTLSGPAQETLAGRALRAQQMQNHQELASTALGRGKEEYQRTKGEKLEDRGRVATRAGIGMRVAGKAAPIAGQAAGTTVGAGAGAIAGVLGGPRGMAVGARYGAKTGGRIGRRIGKTVGKGLETGGRATSQTGAFMNIAGQLKQEQEKAKKEQEEKKGGVASRIGSFGTAGLLRWAWWGLPTVVAFIPALIYINIHVFLRLVIGENLFCKLGDEWAPKQVKAMAGEAGKLGGKAIGIVEVMVLISLDFIAGAIIFGALALIVMIVSWIAEFNEAGFFGKLWLGLKGIWELGWGGVKALVDLFKITL